jgi:hypothetical protein
MSAKIADESKLIIPIVRAKMDAAGKITDQGLEALLLGVINSLKVSKS